LSTRPEKRVGSEQQWDAAEQALQSALDQKKLQWDLQPGEGAFYGPKIEFSLKDSLSRIWQCGTLQLDFSMPERLNASYVTENNVRKVPVMLHRAILGSMERFIGILIEHHAGALPLWLAPEQVIILNISKNQIDYAQAVFEKLLGCGIRVSSDLRNEKINYKIREHSMQKIPYQVIVGDKEMSSGVITVRSRSGEDLGSMTVQDFINRLREELRIASRI